MFTISKRHSLTCAFTLVEVLVVVAVIAILIAILMPALANARKVARMTRELAHTHQMTEIYAQYTLSMKDAVVPGLPSWDYIRPNCPAGPQYQLKAPDPFNRGMYIADGSCKIWTFYLHGWADTPLHALQIEKDTYDNFMRRTRDYSIPYTGWIQNNEYGATPAFAFHPTVGLNGTYVGGSYQHEGWRTGAFANGIPFFVRKMSDVRDSTRLSIFMSSRGGDVQGTTFRGWGSQYPDSGIERPGYMLVTSPIGGLQNTQSWGSLLYGNPATKLKYNPAKPPSTWGNVAFRHFDKACVSAMDGHAGMMTIDDMMDMRRWHNKADRAVYLQPR